jgi:GrpB-like predicted nucleotidyltransferase (UPF0157 family)
VARKPRRTTAELRAITIGEPRRLSGPIALAEYDPNWPKLFESEATKIRQALGDAALGVEHVGSTSVPSLAAKPRIDIVLIVADSADEPAYRSVLEGIGYALRIREPDWFEHRMLRSKEPSVNLHVFSTACEELNRMLLLRDWLRADAADRELYERTKRELASKRWAYEQNNADAKTAVIEEILARAAKSRLA